MVIAVGIGCSATALGWPTAIVERCLTRCGCTRLFADGANGRRWLCERIE